MSRNSRNTTRERGDRGTKSYDQEEDRRETGNRTEERERSVDRVSVDRSPDRNSARENDLYERQSM